MKRSIALLVSALFAALVPQVSQATVSSDSAPARAYIDRPLRGVDGNVSVLMHVAPKSDLATGIATAKKTGFQLGSVYEAIDVFVAYGPAPSLKKLAAGDTFEWFEANRVIQRFTDNSHKATRGQDLLNGTPLMPGGITKIDGSGIGVAVVDSGIDGTHPDLTNRVGGNVKAVCSTPLMAATAFAPFQTCIGPKQYVELEDTDTPSLGGHGTHVSGIIAGDGTASAGKFHGAAPGATLYGVSTGTTLSVENALDGLEWVLDNHDLVTPAIRVVNNSWGSGGHTPYRTGPFHEATWDMQEALIAAGLTVVFAAGNDGGNGSAATTSGECVNPTPGLICVANYDDKNNGTRAGTIATGSSRGAATDPTTWPDLSAPGTTIKSTCRVTLPICTGGSTVEAERNLYGNMSGTSMATPHVSGIVAQLLQVDPTLTPAQIENLLEDTSHKFVFGSPYTMNDPFNINNSSSFEKGHGLVDIRAAVEALLDPEFELEENPGGVHVEPVAPAGDPTPTTLYFHGASPLGELDGLDWFLNDVNPMTLTPEAPAGTETKSMNFLNPALNSQCTGFPLAFPTWNGPLQGTIWGDATVTMNFVSPPTRVVARIWADAAVFQCNAAFIKPASEVKVDVPAGQNAVTFTFPNLNLPAGSHILIEILSSGGNQNGGQTGRVLYDSTGAMSKIEFDCFPANGAASCTP